MDVSILIVSYNTKRLTAQAIQSVLGSGQIIVIDNDSGDGSPEYLHNIFGSKIKIIRQRHNSGFAQANNEGLKYASGKFIFLLNSDTIVTKGSIEALVSALENNPQLAAVSSRLLNEDGSYQPQGGALPSLFNVAAWWLWPIPGVFPGIAPYQDPVDPLHMSAHNLHAVGWAGGTALMIRREVIDRIGLLDENIFMYAEDVDFCIRAHQAGYSIGIIPTATITHLGSRSTGSDNALLGEVRGLLYLWKKHFPAWQKPLLSLLLLKGTLLRYLLFGILKGSSDARRLYGRILKVIV